MELVKDQLCTLSYECRIQTPGDAPECGVIVGRWTGFIDATGRRHIKPEDRNGDDLYLFDDEILEVEFIGALTGNPHEDLMCLVSVKAAERTTLAKQAREYDRAVSKLHGLHREFLAKRLTPEEVALFKKALTTVLALEGVLEARLRGL